MRYLMIHCLNEADYDVDEGVDVHTPETAEEEAELDAWDNEMRKRGILAP